jgi:flagellar hook-associated protein 2
VTFGAVSNLAATIDDGGSGAGAFSINGVTINFSATADSVTDVINRINDSGAGVVASYDAANNRFTLTNKNTGDEGIAVQDVTGNFLAATGLAGGALQRGTNLQYSVNGGGTLTSQSNTINSATSGITGLSVTALAVGSTAISVQSDTSTISTATPTCPLTYRWVTSFVFISSVPRPKRPVWLCGLKGFEKEPRTIRGHSRGCW